MCYGAQQTVIGGKDLKGVVEEGRAWDTGVWEHENNLGRESLQYIGEGMAEKELAVF